MFATLFCSSFAVMFGSFCTFLTKSRAILSEIFLGLPDLVLTSTVLVIFHFLMFSASGNRYIGNIFVVFSFLVEKSSF